jgi:hypothetical protein
MVHVEGGELLANCSFGAARDFKYLNAIGFGYAWMVRMMKRKATLLEANAAVKMLRTNRESFLDQFFIRFVLPVKNKVHPRPESLASVCCHSKGCSVRLWL